MIVLAEQRKVAAEKITLIKAEMVDKRIKKIERSFPKDVWTIPRRRSHSSESLSTYPKPSDAATSRTKYRDPKP